MKRLWNWFASTQPTTKQISQRRRSRRMIEALEDRSMMAVDVLPVLLVIADQQDFYYQEYGDTRIALEAAGLDVQVAARTTNPSTPHAGTGQGDSSGIVVPDIALANVDPANYSAIAFVGGWGASMYQYAFEGTYSNNHYNGDLATKEVVNELINDFIDQDKYVAAVCHGVTVLTWARVDGVSPLAGRQIAVPFIGSPAAVYLGQWYGYYELGALEQAYDNGAIPFATPGIIGDPNTDTDDVWVDGKFITAENNYTAMHFGEVLAEQLLAEAGDPPPPPLNLPPVIAASMFEVPENSPAGTIVGDIDATDPAGGSEITYSIAAGNDHQHFQIDPTTGVISIAAGAILDFEQFASHNLIVEASDGELSSTAEVVISVLDIDETPPVPLPPGPSNLTLPAAPVAVVDGVLIVQGTAGRDYLYVYPGSQPGQVMVYRNGVYHSFAPGVVQSAAVFALGGDDFVGTCLLPLSVEIYGGDGHDELHGSMAPSYIDGGNGSDRIYGGEQGDYIVGGDGDDQIEARGGADLIIGGSGTDTINGGMGRDVLIGGNGPDRLNGGADDDLLIGGEVQPVAAGASLLGLLAAWSVGGATASGLNDYALITDFNVTEDNAVDCLFGGDGSDWLYASPSDYVYQLQSADVLTRR